MSLLGCLFLGLFFVCFLVSVVALLVSKRSSLDDQKEYMFECGFDCSIKSRTIFSMRFFLLCVIFLIFDIEIVLLFPMVGIIWSAYHAVEFMGALILFIVVLLWGLMYEWESGALEWMID